MLSSQTFLIIGLLLTSAEAWAQVDSANPALGSANPALGSANPALGSANPALGSANPALGSANPALGSAKLSVAPNVTHGAIPLRRLQPAAPRAREPGEDHIRKAQGKGPVDVLSLSLGGALACFLVLTLIRRRKSARGAIVTLPRAQAMTSGERDVHDQNTDA
jgi:hypothetical protein